MELTKQDYELLLQSLDSWEKDVGDGLGGTIMMAVIGDRMPPEERAKAEAEINKKEQKRKAEMQHRKERCIMLKAKLLTLRDGMAAEEFIRTGQSVDA
jgi:hypothetical protein